MNVHSMDKNNERKDYKIRRVDELSKDDFLELRELREKVRKLEEDNRKWEQLRDMIECQVCLQVPRQEGPVPVCSNGHFLCCTCRDRIRVDAEGLGVLPKCPTCTVDLGNATSLLASRLVERVKHECKYDDCEDLVEFAHLEKHHLDCFSRKVICPGSGRTCKLEMSFNKVNEHVKKCPDNSKLVRNNNAVIKQRMPQTHKDLARNLYRNSHTVLAHGKTFFARLKRENHNYVCETVMLGNEEECKRFFVSMKILDEDQQIFIAHTSHPRPISQRNWTLAGLRCQENEISSIWWLDGDENLTFDVQISISLA